MTPTDVGNDFIQGAVNAFMSELDSTEGSALMDPLLGAFSQIAMQAVSQSVSPIQAQRKIIGTVENWKKVIDKLLEDAKRPALN